MTLTDTDMKGKSIINTMADLASRRDKVLAFNYASQALNNSFFLDMMVRASTLAS